MKHSIEKIITLVSIVIISTCCTIRTAAQGGEIGVRYMPTISKFDMNVSDGGDVQGEAELGYGVGAFLGLNFTDHMGFQGEIIYNSLSQKYVDDGNETKVELKYVNIPLLLSLNSGKSEPVNFNVVIGPQIGISAGSNVETTDPNQDPAPILVVKNTDLGFAYGAGLDFALTPAQNFRIGLGYRGVIGLVDISDNSNTTETDGYYILEKTDLKTYSLYLGVSVIF